MRKMFEIIVVLIILNMITGCSIFKKRGNDNYVLSEYPLDSFKEVENSNNKLIIKDVNFDYNSSEIKNEFKIDLDAIIVWLKSNNVIIHILIEGYCDERGTNEYNLVLGDQRALSIRAYFINNGISSERVQTISYGEEKPIDLNSNEIAWKKNRRSHFLVSSEK
jgi:peptidoglycan-associated lipoprotein